MFEQTFPNCEKSTNVSCEMFPNIYCNWHDGVIYAAGKGTKTKCTEAKTFHCAGVNTIKINDKIEISVPFTCAEKQLECRDGIEYINGFSIINFVCFVTL